MSNDTNTAGEHSAAWDRAMKAVGDKDTEALRQAITDTPTLVRVSDDNGWTLLHMAAFTRNTDGAKVLLAAGADVSAVSSGYVEKVWHDEDGGMPHHVASRFESPSVLRLLLDWGADVDAPFNVEGDTALYELAAGDTALGKYYEATVRILLEHGADPNLGDPLGRAVGGDRLGVTRLLLDYGAGDDLDQSPLHGSLDDLLLAGEDVGFSAGADMISFLIGRGANVLARNGWGQTILHKVVSFCLEEDWYSSTDSLIITGLVELGADVTAVNKDGRTALDVAHIYVEAATKGGATEAEGKTALHIETLLTEATAEAATPWRRAWHALLSGDIDGLRRVLDAYPELVRESDTNGDTLVHLAPRNKGYAISILLERGADIEALNAAGETPLFNAVRRDCVDMLKESAIDCLTIFSSAHALVSQGSDLLARRPDGMTPLHLAAQLNRRRFLSDCTREWHNPDDPQDTTPQQLIQSRLTAQDNLGRTLLHYLMWGSAGNAKRIGTMNMLVRSGADPDQPDKHGHSPFASAWDAREYSAEFLEGFQRVWQETAEARRAAEGDWDVHGGEALHKAASDGDILTAKILLMYGACLERTDEWGRTPLHVAVWSGQQGMTRLLVDAGADLEAEAQGGYTPYLLAKKEGEQSLADFLARRGANVGAQAEDDDSDFSYDDEEKWHGPVIGGRTDGAMWGEHEIETGAEWNGESENE